MFINKCDLYYLMKCKNNVLSVILTALLEPKPRAPPPPPLQQLTLQPHVSTPLQKLSPLPRQEKMEMKDKDVQKFDLEELMIHMNFIIKTHDMHGKLLSFVCSTENVTVVYIFYVNFYSLSKAIAIFHQYYICEIMKE